MVNIFFDTNILYTSGDKGYDFSAFKLSSRFENIVDKIEVLNYSDEVRILLPQVVFEELKKQQVDEYENKYKELKTLVNQFKSLPNVTLELKDINYEEYLSKQKDLFIDKLGNYQIKVETLGHPSNDRFNNLIHRAYTKKAPFEGVDKKSDKGFKDALLWESILEFAEKNNGNEFILYSCDKKFEEVTVEFEELFDKKLLVAKNEKDIEKYLNSFLQNEKNDKGKTFKIDYNILVEEYLFNTNALSNTLGGSEYGSDSYISSADVLDVYSVEEINDYSFTENITSFIVRCRMQIDIGSYDNYSDDSINEDGEIELVYSLTQKEFRINMVDFGSGSYGFSAGVREDGIFVDSINFDEVE